MWFIENDEGLMWSEDGAVDDLDYAATFETEDDAVKKILTLGGGWYAQFDVSEE